MSARLSLGALVGALLFAACAGGSGPPADTTPVTPTNGEIHMRAFEWGFDPPAVLLRRGEQVTILLTNDGSTLHDLLVSDLGAQLVEKDSSGPLSGDADELFVSVAQGREASLTFVPDEAGTFTFYCTISGHRQLGMAGTIIVE